MAYRSWIGSSYYATGAYGTNTEWNRSTNWTPSTFVTASDIGRIDNNYTAGTNIAFTLASTSNNTPGGLWVDSTFPQTRVQFDSNTNGVSWRSPINESYTFQVAAGKELVLNAAGTTGFSGNNFATNPPKAFVAANALLGLRNFNSTTNLGEAGKYGPGPMYFGYRWTVANNTNPAGVSSTYSGGIGIYEGSIRVRGQDLSTFSAGNAQVFGTGAITFRGSGTSIVLQASPGSTGGSQTYPNNISLALSPGTIRAEGSNTIGFSGAVTGSNTLTIEGDGTGAAVALNSSLGMPLVVSTGGVLNLGSTYNLTGSTLTGGGTIQTNGSVTTTISNNAPDFTGTINGLFLYSAGTRAATRSMRGNIAGTVRIPAGTITFTNPNNTGYLEIIDDADVTLQNSFFNGSGNDGLTGSWVYMRGNAVAATRAIVRLVGAAAGCAQGRWWAPRNNSHIYLTQGSTLNTNGFFVDTPEPNPPSPYIISDDTNTNTFSAGAVTPANGTVSSPVSVNFTCLTNGIFVVTGSLYATAPNGAASSGSANFTFNTVTPQPNGTPAPTADYEGTIRWTGTCLGSVSNLTVGRGTLQIVRSTPTGLAAGLTVQSGATLHCATPNAAYAAQLSGNVTLAAGSIMKFGTA